MHPYSSDPFRCATFAHGIPRGATNSHSFSGDRILADHSWPLVYAMGAPESVLAGFERVWEGHLRQFGRARLPTVDLAGPGCRWTLPHWSSASRRTASR
jgi:hypothetical protein